MYFYSDTRTEIEPTPAATQFTHPVPFPEPKHSPHSGANEENDVFKTKSPSKDGGLSLPASFSIFAKRNIRPTPGRMRKMMLPKQIPRPKTAVYRSPRHFPFSRSETPATLRANEENDVSKTNSPSKDGGLSQPASFSIFAERNIRPTPGRMRKMMLPKQIPRQKTGYLFWLG